MYLMNTVYVATVTGEAFGAPDCIRISFATNDEKLVIALERIRVALEKLI
jgi:aspartate aminotransferase